MANDVMEIFRRRVRALMDEQGVTLSELARRMECQPPNISRLLNSDDNVTIRRAERVANALHTPLSELFTENLVAT